MQRNSRIYFVVGMVGALVLLLVLAGIASATSSPAGAALPRAPQDGYWEVVNSPNVGTGDNSLQSVTGNSANDVVAVGYYLDASSHAHTLVEGWNGTSWGVLPSQDPDPNSNSFASVAVDMAGGYWAAGSSLSSTYQTLIERESVPGGPWSLVKVPAISGSPSLSGISAASATDAWAVGQRSSGSPNYVQQTLVMHWNGTSWIEVASPNPFQGDNFLTGVVALDANNMWAVGYANTPPSYNSVPITIHCNSSLTCTSVSFPMAGTSGQLRAVSGRIVAGTAQLYGAGFYYDGTGVHAIVGYGDGNSWSLLSPNQPYVLNGIYAPSITIPELGAGGVVGVGDDETPGYSQIVPSSLISSTVSPGWQRLSPVVVGTGTTLFFGAGGAPGGPLWAVGYSAGASGHDMTLIQRVHACFIPLRQGVPGDCGTSTPTPVGSPTGNVPPPTHTATTTATPQEHPQLFEDVIPGSTFYDFIQSLGWHELISGYQCGTPPAGPCVPPADLPYFRPNESVSRGQIAKIIANLRGFSEATPTPTPTRVPAGGSRLVTGGQSFQDVPPGSTFYTYIEQLYALGAIGGYPCGGLNEPCVPPANLPYFRPNHTVTRGQLSKIAAIARGLPAPPPGQQTFQDVPLNSTFWQWIEELSTTGAISGYACGGPNEPCVPPLNRPYFRPGNRVTRGQTAKIADLAFGISLDSNR